MKESSNDPSFLKFMRDQGAQRAYRNVLDWLKEMTILDAIGRVNAELLLIDARREAFQRTSLARAAQKGKEGKWTGREDLRKMLERIKRLRRKPRAPKRSSPRRTR